MTVNWGILGAGKFARTHMGPAIHRANGARLAAIASGSADRIADMRALAPDLTVYADYDNLLNDPAIDAVYIPLPNHLHVEWTLKAIEAGKPVLVEKPLGLTAEDYDRVIEARDASGLLVAEAFMIVHHPQWHLAKKLLSEGAVGDLIHVDAAFAYNNADDPGNIRNRPETGGGSLPDIGVYTLGSVRFATGKEPEAISFADLTLENDVDVIARVCARFPGFSFQSLTSMRMAPRQEVVFHGTEGVLRLSAPFNPGVFAEAKVKLFKGTEAQEWRFPTENHYVNQVEVFGRALETGNFPCSLEFSRGTQKMIDQVFSIARS